METKEEFQGQARLISEVIEKGLCVKCGACVRLCPYFDYFDGQVVVLDRCNAETWRCLQLCPRIQYDRTLLLNMLEPSGTNDEIGYAMEVFAARSTNREIRERSQYGGVVTSLVVHLLETGYLSAAIMTDSGNLFSPEGKICNNPEQVLACSGSRYSASGTLSALNEAIKQGKERLGIIGLPCQMEALARMGAMEPDGKERADHISFKIGLFCTWALDFRKLRDYLERNGILQGIKKFDIPPPPAEVFVVETESGKREFPLSEIRPLVQSGCSLCEDMTAEFSDISVGALEGQEGWNTVIVRTKLGAQVMESALKKGILERKEIPSQNLQHLKQAASNKRRRALDAKREEK